MNDSKPSPHHPDAATLTRDLADSLRQTTDQVVPDFIRGMPEAYFQDTEHGDWLSHLRAIIAAEASGLPLEITLKSEDDRKWTFIRSTSDPAALVEMLRDLPDDRAILAAKVHAATDGNMMLVTFEFGVSPRFDASDDSQLAKVQLATEYAQKECSGFDEAEFRDFCSRASAELVSTLTPLRLARVFENWRAIRGTSGALVFHEMESIPDRSRIVVTAEERVSKSLLMRIADHLSREGITIHRAYLDTIDGNYTSQTPSFEREDVVNIAFVVSGPDGKALDPASEIWPRVRDDLERIKWVDASTRRLFMQHDRLSLVEAEVLMALCHLAHQVLVKLNADAFDRDRILKCVKKNIRISHAIVLLFIQRFDPDSPLAIGAYSTQAAALRNDIETNVDRESSRQILTSLLDAIGATLRTNLFVQNRYALSFRLNPALFDREERTAMPHGVFFVHGRSFNGFHVRFRDISRGGIRAVRTIGPDQHAREIQRLYDEVYGLAFAQQLKNKDIPEGGAKAVVLIEPRTPVARSVKAFVDSLLDLVTPDEETNSRIVDLLECEELLYLGPDENITVPMIEWIVDRARLRGYPCPTALMSSKPGAGINHKEYGVTSEGVTVFLDVALRYLGIDPKNQPFTVKITGGPDGDVAGNEIKILRREYGDNARIVGIADGSGCGEDPKGLDYDELCRLVEAGLPIAEFNPKSLGPEGRISSVDDPDGISLRNSLHNRLQADAFIPAGGRPGTIHAGNWRDFLQPDGQPSSRLIVEGANIYLTNEARHALSEAGVLIVKDSSANKCGVITSSFEIAACMILEESEFLEIKEEFVQQVLQKLRVLARREAELLIRLLSQHPRIPLFEMSVRLSRVMIRTADAIEASLDSLTDEHRALFAELVIEHLPAALVEKAKNRVWEKTPEPYLRWIMAKTMATRLVYREGFESIEAMPDEAIASLAVSYREREKERADLADTVRESTLADKERIAQILDRAGILQTLGKVDNTGSIAAS